ncbi:MAG: hypothetical protein AAGB19_09480 [Cyanobacteria bacterium P01_F01_bin.3]
MADITAAEINTQLGVAAFDDNGGAGPLTLNLDVLTGDSMTLASDMAEAVFKVMNGASSTAAALEKATDTYPGVVRTVQTIGGEPKARYTATIGVAAPLDYDSITAIS